MNSRMTLAALALVACLTMLGAAQGEKVDPPKPAAKPSATQPTARPAGHPPRATATSGPASRPAVELSEQRIREVMDRLKAERPEAYRHLSMLQKARPAEFRRAIADVSSMMQRMDRLPPEQREAYWQAWEDGFRAAQLSWRVRHAKDPAEKTHLQAELREVVAHQFDNTQKIREYELQQKQRDLENLTKRLEALKTQWNERNDRRSELIDTRVKNLMEGKGGRTW